MKKIIIVLMILLAFACNKEEHFTTYKLEVIPSNTCKVNFLTWDSHLTQLEISSYWSYEYAVNVDTQNIRFSVSTGDNPTTMRLYKNNKLIISKLTYNNGVITGDY